MTPEEELKALKQLLLQAVNINQPPRMNNIPSGPPELVHGYKVGYVNGWVHYRQYIKQIVFPQGNT